MMQFFFGGGGGGLWGVTTEGDFSLWYVTAFKRNNKNGCR